MKLKPILFSTPMVEAILNGTKTQTRRIVKPQPDEDGLSFNLKLQDWQDTSGVNYKSKANIGDIFWVRETWQITDFLHPSDENYGYIYKASENGREWESNTKDWKWRPSIFMPKAACRLFLKVTNVRVERLHDISEEDAESEGIDFNNLSDGYLDKAFKNYLTGSFDFDEHMGSISSFFTLWESINGKQSLESNPWVWVYEFEKTKTPF